MKNKLLFMFTVACTLYSASPSKFIEPAQFYTKDFDHKTGMKYISYETKVGVIGDEVYIGRPRVYCNDNIVMCECGKEAVNICFKKGDLYATCYDCGPKKEPVNQIKFGDRNKTAKEINEKPKAK